MRCVDVRCFDMSLSLPFPLHFVFALSRVLAWYVGPVLLWYVLLCSVMCVWLCVVMLCAFWCGMFGVVYRMSVLLLYYSMCLFGLVLGVGLVLGLWCLLVVVVCLVCVDCVGLIVVGVCLFCGVSMVCVVVIVCVECVVVVCMWHLCYRALCIGLYGIVLCCVVFVVLV